MSFNFGQVQIEKKDIRARRVRAFADAVYVVDCARSIRNNEEFMFNIVRQKSFAHQVDIASIILHYQNFSGSITPRFPRLFFLPNSVCESAEGSAIKNRRSRPGLRFAEMRPL